MLNDAIMKERECAELKVRIGELDDELERLFGQLGELGYRRRIVEGYIEQTEITRSFLEVRLGDLEEEISEIYEARAEAYEREFDRGAYGARAARERSEVAYGRLWHGDCAWYRAAKKAARGCDASKKKHRKKTREACRKAARAERAAQSAAQSDGFVVFLTDDDE